jgi:DNA mismatch endonuclease (patch repair protein)
MPDVFTKAERSAVMSRIRGRGNKATELALVQLFRRHNISGWRRQQPVFGKPDFIFRRERVTDHFKTSHSGSNQNQPLQGA